MKFKKSTQNKLTHSPKLKTVGAINFNHEDSSDDGDELFCFVCLFKHRCKEEYKGWLKCNRCKMLAHSPCAKYETYYLCIDCDSD